MTVTPIGPNGVDFFVLASAGLMGILKVYERVLMELGFFTNVFAPNVVPENASYSGFVVA